MAATIAATDSPFILSSYPLIYIFSYYMPLLVIRTWDASQTKTIGECADACLASWAAHGLRH
jgi:hypothetical protein